MGVVRVLVRVLGAGNGGLVIAAKPAERKRTIAVATAEPRDTPPAGKPKYPSQSESAALLDAALDRARDKTPLASGQ
jgi:hypothetical protein